MYNLSGAVTISRLKRKNFKIQIVVIYFIIVLFVQGSLDLIVCVCMN